MMCYLPRWCYGVTSVAAALPVWAEDVAEVAKPLVAASEKLGDKSSAAAPAAPSLAQLDISGMLGSLLLVVLCIVVLMWLLRKSRLVAGPNHTGVAVVGQIPLSMKEKLLVVQVGDDKLLLGCTASAINTLHTWSSPSSQDSAASTHQNSPFAKLLARLPTHNSAKANTPSNDAGAKQ